ncbi:DMT family transporter [Roseisolibacter agri]|uniref:Membrane protein n=1 Tax=Roseisolibacter agri TaxID=2014610 RepID=A0AA37V1V2_9BACT|nr:EamA family transporter [Roseisolibacter agri]GLC26845.1 membrane protein [Roseisolibacter agri]
MGYVWILLAAALWGTLGPAARLALRDGVEPLELGFWRALVGGALFAAHALSRRRMRVAPRDLPAFAGFALVGVALFYVSYFRAVNAGGAALAAILLYTAPAWVAIASALWLKERLTPRTAAALALTLGGVALVALGSGAKAGGVRLGGAAVAWGLVAGLAYAVYYLFGKRYFVRYEAPTVLAYALPLGALALLPAVRFALKSATTWIVLTFIAVVPTYLAYYVYGLGLRRLPATRAATVATMEPVVAAALAYLVWGEALRPLGYAGAVLVLAGVLVIATAGAPDPERHETG